jgi:hypothetical protein
MVARYSGPRVSNNKLTQQGECFYSISEKRYRRHAVFLCECGNSLILDHHAVICGKTKSCGCIQRNPKTSNRFKHGHTSRVVRDKRSRAYNIWSKMTQRCNNPNNPKFKIYGGRGISYCKRWESFENFLEDMGEPEKDLSLDRINVNGNYEKSNCRWATAKQQSNNGRFNIIVELNGEKMTLKQAAEKSGVNYKLFWKYVRKNNMPVEEAIKKCRGLQ